MKLFNAKRHDQATLLKLRCQTGNSSLLPAKCCKWSERAAESGLMLWLESQRVLQICFCFYQATACAMEKVKRFADLSRKKNCWPYWRYRFQKYAAVDLWIHLKPSAEKNILIRSKILTRCPKKTKFVLPLNKSLNDWFLGEQWILFPSNRNVSLDFVLGNIEILGKQNSLFPSGPVIKVAEHTFQVPMPNSLLLLNYLWFGTRFLQESRLTTEEFILAFWLRCVLLPWQRGWLKTRLKKWFLFI